MEYHCCSVLLAPNFLWLTAAYNLRLGFNSSSSQTQQDVVRLFLSACKAVRWRLAPVVLMHRSSTSLVTRAVQVLWVCW